MNDYTLFLAHPRHVHQPSSKLAAVLVLLYERAGGLRVLLTTRSKELRSHPGQTALPGGKVDEGDAGVVETAVSLSCIVRAIIDPLMSFSLIRWTEPPPPLYNTVQGSK